jgi:hypothetical protein
MGGKFCLSTMDNDGKWGNAADMNIGGTKKFVYGPYAGQALGTYGVDPKTRTVWAVLNYNSNFAARLLA